MPRLIASSLFTLLLSVPAFGEAQSAAAKAPWIWTLGTGMEARLERDVNPDYADVTALGQLFVQLHRGSWGGHVEFSREDRESSAGGLYVDSVSNNIGGWARYRILGYRWEPLFAGGVGAYFDRVTSSYGSSSVERDGRRLYWGLGVGLRRVLWERMLVEGEGRVALVQDRKDPSYSALLRLGLTL